jgi:lipoate-protein ligase A
MDNLRLLIDPPRDGPWNMAVDEALLETAAERGVGTLRFYTWQEPTLSLGYFQSLAERAQHPPSSGCPLVRRASGGGAILHDQELTYSLALPRLGTAAARELYDAAHLALIAALAQLGVSSALHQTVEGCRSAIHPEKPVDRSNEPFLCFQRRTCTDVILGEAKIAGSAQRRRRGAVLQHGSVLLERSRFAPELPGICELTGNALCPSQLIERWLDQLTHRLHVTPIDGALTPAEAGRSHALAADRFADESFLARR